MWLARITQAVLMLCCAVICLILAKIEVNTNGFTWGYWIFIGCMLGCILCAIFYWHISGREECSARK